jgi:hypothetical protein
MGKRSGSKLGLSQAFVVVVVFIVLFGQRFVELEQLT